MTALARLWRWLTTPQPPAARRRYRVDWREAERLLVQAHRDVVGRMFDRSAFVERLDPPARFEHDA